MQGVRYLEQQSQPYAITVNVRVMSDPPPRQGNPWRVQVRAKKENSIEISISLIQIPLCYKHISAEMINGDGDEPLVKMTPRTRLAQTKAKLRASKGQTKRDPSEFVVGIEMSSPMDSEQHINPMLADAVSADSQNGSQRQHSSPNEDGSGSDGDSGPYRLPPMVRFRRSEGLEKYLCEEPEPEPDESDEDFQWRIRRWQVARAVESAAGRGFVVALIIVNAVLVGCADSAILP